MPDRCFKDGFECYHECPECNSYRDEITCPECYKSIKNAEFDKYKGMCQECRLKEEIENQTLYDEFMQTVKCNDELSKAFSILQEAYKNFLDEYYNK